MPNANVNHVVVDGVTKIDLRADTVSPASLMSGYTAHDASGAAIVGTATGGDSGTAYQDQDGYIVLDDDESTAPQGSVSISANGTYDVTAYASAVVAVPSGGGGGNWTLLKTESLGSVVSSSTTQTSLGKSITVSGCTGYDLLFVESTVDTVASSSHVSTIAIVGIGQLRSSPTTVYNGACWNTVANNKGLTNTSILGTSSYGVYPSGSSISSGTVTLPMYVRYNSTTTSDIDGTYSVNVYGMNLIDFIGLGVTS